MFKNTRLILIMSTIVAAQIAMPAYGMARLRLFAASATRNVMAHKAFRTGIAKPGAPLVGTAKPIHQLRQMTTNSTHQGSQPSFFNRMWNKFLNTLHYSVPMGIGAYYGIPTVKEYIQENADNKTIQFLANKEKLTTEDFLTLLAAEHSTFNAQSIYYQDPTMLNFQSKGLGAIFTGQYAKPHLEQLLDFIKNHADHKLPSGKIISWASIMKNITNHINNNRIPKVIMSLLTDPDHQLNTKFATEFAHAMMNAENKTSCLDAIVSDYPEFGLNIALKDPQSFFLYFINNESAMQKISLPPTLSRLAELTAKVSKTKEVGKILQEAIHRDSPDTRLARVQDKLREGYEQTYTRHRGAF